MIRCPIQHKLTATDKNKTETGTLTLMDRHSQEKLSLNTKLHKSLAQVAHIKTKEALKEKGWRAVASTHLYLLRGLRMRILGCYSP